MSPIWKMVGLTMLITLGGGFFWHWSEMSDIHHANEKKLNVLRDEVKLLTAYNEVLKKDGLPAANEYLEKIPKTYGF